MSSFASEVREYLIAQGITAPILYGSKAVLPTKGTVLQLREYGGAAPYRTHNTGAAVSYERPSMQIIAHSEHYGDAEELARQVYHAVTLRNAYIGQTWYVLIEPKQAPFDMGLDANGRVKFGFNIDALKRPSS